MTLKDVSRGNKVQASSTPKKNPFGQQEQKQRAALAETPGLLAAIDLAIEAGAAVMLGRTSDGGAYVVTVLDGDDRWKDYATSRQDIDRIALSLRNAYAQK